MSISANESSTPGDSGGTADESIGANDCLLAIGLPATCDEFQRRFALTEYDYSKFVHEQAGGGETLTLASFIYQRVSRMIEYTCRMAENRGFAVARYATLSSLNEALATGTRALTLLAHWKLLTIELDEILLPRRFLDLLHSHSDDPAHQSLQSCWEKSISLCPPFIEHSDCTNEQLLADIVPRFQHFVGIANSYFLHDERSELLKWNTCRPLTRVCLERLFPPEVLRRGRFIELYDGMHTLDEFISAIPVDWTGVLDLSMCHSALAFDAIRKARTNCRLVVNRFPAIPANRLLRHLVISKAMQARKQSYVQLLYRIHALRINLL